MARQEALLRIHKTLAARRHELRKRLGIELEDLAHTKHSSASGDAADAAFDASGEEIASTLAELEAKELAQVERALRRLKGGTYGKCEACGTKIPVARLNALPYSTVCIKCQREMESEGGFNGRSLADWARLSEGGSPMEDRDVSISDLEIDLSK
jgi:RNA polymerase-binding transcription factor